MLDKDAVCIQLVEAAVSGKYFGYVNSATILSFYADLADGLDVANLKKAHLQIALAALRNGTMDNGHKDHISHGAAVAKFCNEIAKGIEVPPNISFD